MSSHRLRRILNATPRVHVYALAGIGIFFISLLLGVSMSQLARADQLAFFNFNAEGDLLNNFNPDSNANYEQGEAVGLNNTRGVITYSEEWANIFGLYVTKESFAIPNNSTLTVSSYFFNSSNNGYGGIGFYGSDAGDPADFPQPGGYSVGVIFHGGGGDFYVNGNAEEDLSWNMGDLILETWYKMVFSISSSAGDVYNLNFQIWESDNSGNLVRLKTVHTLQGVEISNFRTLVDVEGQVHAYFGTESSRFTSVDDFGVVDSSTVNDWNLFDAGSGTEEDPYIIKTCFELQQMSGLLESHFRLYDDIACSATSGWNNGAGFYPVGDSNYRFNGTLDGNNKTITGLYINRDTNYVGLFGVIGASGEVKNLKITGANVTGNDYTGILAGGLVGTAERVEVSGDVSGGIM